MGTLSFFIILKELFNKLEGKSSNVSNLSFKARYQNFEGVYGKMLVRFLRKKAVGHILLNLMLILTLIMSSTVPVLASDLDVLPEIRQLLQNQYVDPVAPEVLNAPTVDETLERLGDPHTIYFTPEEYKDFVGSIDMRFYGIGIHIEVESEGVRVVSVISGSPAEKAGLKSGDLIVSADGQSLVGLPSDSVIALIRGPEGSTVQIRVQRETETRDFNVMRKAITEPTITGEVLDGHIGYLDLNSFGSDTPTEFQTVVKQLRSKNVDGWIVDLRDNGGGYLSAALDLAGFFIGPDVVVGIKDRTGSVSQYKAPDHGFTLSQPVIFLTNGNSASASEILSAAVKDHQKATLVGTTTYGKGTVQSMFTLSNGGVLKMTVDHFYSPLGHGINKIGVKPDVEIRHADSLRAAELMLSNEAEALAKARTTDYWQAWGELKNSVAANVPVERYALYYPGYHKISELSAVPLDKKFTVHFNGSVNWQSVNSASLELINSETGARTPAQFQTLGPADVQVIPNAALNPNMTYWLVIHPSVLDVKGLAMSGGAVAIARTIEETAKDTSKIQSFNKYQESITGSYSKGLQALDYGWALWDLDKRP